MLDKVRLIYNKIENRIDEICDDGFVLKENQQEYETLTDLEDFINSFPKEPTSESLEEAANFYANTHIEWFDSEGNPCVMPAFKAGAEWQKQQMKEALQTEYEKGRFDMREEMMKDVVEGEVVYKIGNAEIAPTDVRYKVMSDRVYIPNVKLGDKVKIIIVKTEQQ
jgi:hypothetical protein